MPLYEGIALIQEKQAVVLDLGSEYTKFGFAGEAAPRCIVRSEYWCPRERRTRRVFDFADAEELHYNLVQLLHTLYFRHVLVNPKERRVVVVESLLTPSMFRETLAKVLYLHYEVSGVMWVDSGRAVCAALGAASALVVRLGAREAEVGAVLHAVPLLLATQTHALGTNAVHQHLARLLDEDNNTTLNLHDHVIEDIKVKCCFVGSRARALAWAAWAEGEGERPAEARAVRYPVRGGTLLVSGRTRELAAEPLFVRDRERLSLPDLLLRCVLESPVDARRPLCAGVAVVGGGAAMPGLRARLREETAALAEEAPYRGRVPLPLLYHRPAAHDNSARWAGGAVLGALPACPRSLPRDQYLRTRRLPDWSDLRDNTPPHHHHQQQREHGL